MKLSFSLRLFFFFCILTLLSACSLFENDVADFMEKYTETAAIEQHSFNIETYRDASNQLCIPSDQDVTISFYMRNPKKFSLIPSANFNNLDSQINRSCVDIEQTDFSNIELSLPQSFLISADEGKDIAPVINLYEPMSGRDFARYTVNLYCNSKPPVILNPTVLNNGNKSFVLAFDMPNEEEVAIRHKDLAEVVINGKSYPVSVTAVPDPNAAPENPDAKIAEYEFSDSHFSRNWNNSFTFLNNKNFSHNKNSVYFETGEVFSADDKEYTIVLKDKAGLSSTVKASTSISKLEKPLIKDQSGYEIAEGGLAGIPFDEETETGKITIIPPAKDHLGNAVSGATVYYKVYEATGNGLIYTSGTTTSELELELPQNTYRVEAYAALTNYENSATRTVRFRFMNNTLFVEANAQNGDGSEAAPYATIAEALADINDTENRKTKASVFTIYVEGDFTTQTSDKNGIQGNYGQLDLANEYNTHELIITKNPRPKESNEAKLEYISLFTLDEDFKVTLGNITISNASGDGITMGASNTLVIDGTEIRDCSDEGIEASDGNIIIKKGKISGCNNGISASHCKLVIEDGEITANTNYSLLFDSNADCLISGGRVSDIYVDNGCTLKLQGTPVTKVKLALNGIITVADKLLNGCQVEIDTPGITLNLGDASVPIVNNYIYNTEAPAEFFTSTQGYSIIKTGSSVSIAKLGANGGMYTAMDYDVKMTATASVNAVLNKAKSVTVAVSGTRKEASGTTIDLYYNNADGKFYTDPSFTTKAAGDNTVTFVAALYNGGTKACDCTVAAASEAGKILVTVPALAYEDTYTLKVKSTFLGITREVNVEYKQMTGDIDAEDLTAENYDSVTEISVLSPAGMNIISSLSATKTFEGKTIILGNDIELDSDFKEIGYSVPDVSQLFKGTFDGNKKTISGLNGQKAVFQGVCGGTVKDLTVEGSSTRAGIAAWMSGGLIEGCISRVRVIGTERYVGGITGMTSGSATIKNCVNEGHISSSKGHLGGIAGHQNQGGDIIDSCVNKGTVEYTGTDNTHDDYLRIGGIIGSCFTIVRNCINTGAVIGSSTSQVGGIAGAAYSYKSGEGIINCTNLASVSANYDAGGITGFFKMDNSSYFAAAKNCFNAGNVTITDSSKTTAGSIVGKINGGSGTCTLEHNYYKPGTASGGIGATNGVSVEEPVGNIPGTEEMNSWVNANNPEGLYKTWIIKNIDGVDYPVPDVGFDW